MFSEHHGEDIWIDEGETTFISFLEIFLRKDPRIWRSLPDFTKSEITLHKSGHFISSVRLISDFQLK